MFSFPGKGRLMNQNRIVFIIFLGIVLGLFSLAGTVTAAPLFDFSTTPIPSNALHVATTEELNIAFSEWSISGHSETYDNGMGANTTCASCKSPMNWDPASPALEAAHDCASCKRIPGAPRPDLPGGVVVPQSEWLNIDCPICHQPMGDSFSKEFFYWDTSQGRYESVNSSTELCAKCHERQHGFEVVEEQNISLIHNDWDCVKCHGPHGKPSSCTDCHDPQQSSGASEHSRHPNVNCTACHDQGKLSIWFEVDPNSKHVGQYIPRRFAHALRSWPSHNLGKEVDCLRCHHPLTKDSPVVAEKIACVACHSEGEVLFWCTYFARNPDPNIELTPTGTP